MLRLFPRPKVPRVYAGFCRCRCHDVVEADVLESAQRTGAALGPMAAINGLGSIAVVVTLVAEAAAACDVCRDGHCPALSGRPPELGYTPAAKRPAAPPTPWVDPPAVILPPRQADGDDGC